MSRQTLARSRADKAGAGKGSSAPTPAITQEIVPGKYNDHDWNLMVDHDEGDEFVVGLVEEICDSAIDIIYKQYIEKQLVPYTVTQAKDAILQIIEWQFLSRDDGEIQVETDTGWYEDEEPEPGITDCWAQGSVPKQVVATPRSVKFGDETAEDLHMASIAEVESEEVSEDQEGASPREEEGSMEADQPQEEVKEEEEVISRPPSQPLTPEPPAQEKTEEKPKRRFKFKPYRGKLKSAGLSQLTESLDDTEMKLAMQNTMVVDARSPDLHQLQMPSSCHSIIKLQAGRPPANRDVIYDEYGNVLSVTKINPEKLPSHRVKTLFSIVDPETEAAQARLEAMRTGRYQSSSTNKGPTGSKAGWNTTSRSDQSESRTQGTTQKTTSTHSSNKAPLPPPLLETMEVSPGVVVREGDRVKKGPRQHSKRMDQHAGSQSLRPIAIRAKVPVVTVSELLEHQVPVVKPLRESPVMPPIHGSYHHTVSSR